MNAITPIKNREKFTMMANKIKYIIKVVICKNCPKFTSL